MLIIISVQINKSQFKKKEIIISFLFLQIDFLEEWLEQLWEQFFK